MGVGARGGCKVFREFVPREKIRAAWRVVSAAALRRGWLLDEGSPRTALSNVRFAHDAPEFVGFQADVLGCVELEELREDPGLLAAVGEVSAGQAVALRADVCRIAFPGEPHGTPAHQDASYLRRTGLWTAWMPLVPCTVEMGPLQVAVGSHRLGLLAHDGDRGIADPPELSWSTPSLDPGDVLLFHGMTVHRSLPNRSQGLARLSVDLRYAAG